MPDAQDFSRHSACRITRCLSGEPDCPRRLTPFAIYALLLVLIIGLVLLPLIGAITASVIGGAAGCRVDEGGSYPCIVMGQDIGTMLSTLFVMGWLMFATTPVGGLLILAWAIAQVIHRVRR